MSPTFADPLVTTMQWVFVVAWAIAIITLLWLRRNGSPYLLATLTLVALTSHQIEEYLVAPLLLGEEYHFLNWAFRAGVDIAPLEVATVNLLGYAGALVLYAMSPGSRAFAFFFLFINGMTLANGMFHVGVATAQTDYSPGMITGLFMFLPLYIRAIALCIERGALYKQIVGLSVYVFVTHFLLIWLI